jgi:hypothetical protein
VAWRSDQVPVDVEYESEEGTKRWMRSGCRIWWLSPAGTAIQTKRFQFVVASVTGGDCRSFYSPWMSEDEVKIESED